MKALEAIAYAIFRIVAGFMFLLHGVRKLVPEWLPPSQTPEDYVRWLGGGIEAVGGFLIVFGLFTRPAAFIASGMMAVAYWQVHGLPGLQNGKPLPIQNGGELAVLYCFAFLFMAARGGGFLSLDSQREKRTPAAQHAH